jgi:hypothetical protein
VLDQERDAVNHSLLPSISRATLPEKYEAAKVALAECNRIDECKNWADKSAALASYAKQGADKEMENTAMRIRARAIRRCGELLDQIEKKQGGDRRDQRGGKSPLVSRKSAAKAAGMSDDQMKDALRVAKVNGESFERQMESDNPPTITALAEQGKSKAVPHYVQQGMTKKAFQVGMYFRGRLRDMVETTKEYGLQDVVDGSMPHERDQIRSNIKTLETYFDKLKEKL